MDEQIDTTEKIYILDTNILINFSIWCPMEFNEGFWLKLEKLLEERRWILLDVVVNEVLYNQKLKSWLKKQKDKKLVMNIDDNVRNRAVEINSKYPMINNTGNSTGDTYIIAYAEINQLGIFTRESNKDIKDNLYKIPDVCSELNIKYTRHPRQFMKEIGFQNVQL